MRRFHVTLLALAVSVVVAQAPASIPDRAANRITSRLQAVFQQAATQLQDLKANVPPISDSNSKTTLSTMWWALQNNTDIDEIWAADTSDGGSYTIVDIDKTGGPTVQPLVLLKNSSFRCLQYFRLDVLSLALTNASQGEGCQYDATQRSWWAVAANASGQVAVTPMMSLFQAPIATLMFTTMWQSSTRAGTSVTSTLTSVVTSEKLSQHLMDTVSDFPGSDVILFEVAGNQPGKVIAASWPEPNLVDGSHYNQNHVNPLLMLPTLANVSGSAAVTVAIERLGGPAALLTDVLPADTTINYGRDTVIVRDVRVAAVPSLALRVLVVLPKSPEHVAYGINRAVTFVYNEAVYQLLGLRAAVPPINDRSSDYVLRQLLSALEANTNIDEITAADLSDSPSYAMVDVDWTAGRNTAPKVFVKNHTLPCLQSYMYDRATDSVAYNGSSRSYCTYDPTQRTWWAYANASRPNVAVTPMMSLGQAPIATIMFTVMYSQPDRSGVSVTSTLTSVMTSETLSRKLMVEVREAVGAACIIYETLSGRVIAASWPEVDLVDETHFNQAHTNPYLVLPTLANVSGNNLIRLAIDAVGVAALTSPGQLPPARYLSEHGHYIAVSDVNSTLVMNLAHRVLSVIPVARNGGGPFNSPPTPIPSPTPGAPTPTTTEEHRQDKHEAFQGLLVLLLLCACGVGIVFFFMSKKKKDDEAAAAVVATAGGSPRVPPAPGTAAVRPQAPTSRAPETEMVDYDDVDVSPKTEEKAAAPLPPPQSTPPANGDDDAR